MSSVPKKVEGLRWKGSIAWYRARVPSALIAKYGKTEVWERLGELTGTQAKTMALKAAARWAETFEREQHGLGKKANGPAVSASGVAKRIASVEEVREVARASARNMLAEDEEARIWGIRSVHGELWTSQLSDIDAAVETMLAEGHADSELWHRFRADLRAHGLVEPTDTIEKRRLLRTWAVEQGKALQAIQQRTRGLPVETPPPVPVGHAKRMRDAYEAWKGTAVRSEKTVGTFRRHVQMFEEMMGNPPLHTLKRGDGLRFRDMLTEWAVRERKTAETANNVLASIKAITNAARDREWLEVSPFDKMEVTQGGKESEGREPWTREELPVLFDSPLFMAYQLPQGDSIATKGGRDAAYWVPLLAAYTGARAGELCQLWADDVSEQDGGLVIEFRANRNRGQKLKNKGSWRAVPVHGELLRLGFREYWLSMKEGDENRLFPHIPTEGQNGAAGQFGHWFGEYKRSRGFQTATKTLHSFRHTVVSELVLAGVEEAIRHAITGHEGKTVHDKVYAATVRRQAERLRPYVEKIVYPGLSLPRVYKAP